MTQKSSTITELLAELKTIQKRIATKEAFVLGDGVLYRQDGMRDPLEKQSGSLKAIEGARQAVGDLRQRSVDIRLAIGRANAGAELEVCGATRSIAEWLIWRREVAPGESQFLNKLTATIQKVRQQAGQRNITVVGNVSQATTSQDIIVNVSELELAASSEELQEILGTLDGLLSHANATIKVTI